MFNWDNVWIPILVALPGLIAALIGYLNTRTIKQVHVAVNSNLADALRTVASLRGTAVTTNAALVDVNSQLQAGKAKSDAPKP